MAMSRADRLELVHKWDRRVVYRRAEWHKNKKGTPGRAKWYGLLKQAKERRAYHAKKLAELDGWKPKIIDLDLNVVSKFGGLGTVVGVTGHWTAGPRDRTDAEAVRLWRQYDKQHRAQDWGGEGYHIGITSNGSIGLLRPVWMKGAHTLGANTGRIGIVVHGKPGDKPTAAQAKTIAWLAEHGHTVAMPSSHRAPVDLQHVQWRGHNDFNATLCPGSFKTMYTSKGARR